MQVTIGKTGITVEKNGFGALPVQRVDKGEAVKLLRRAYDGGFQYFDTARNYTDSEEKLGEAFSHMRDQIVIATKTGAGDGDGVRRDLETSLRNLRTDYIDIYQFHNPRTCPRPDDGTGRYEAALEAQAAGKIRFISITSHRLDVATEAIRSGNFATLQYPFNYLSTEKEIAIMRAAVDAGMGFLAMKGLSGGLINNSAAAAVWMNLYPQVVPLWGIQREHELDEFLAHMKNPPALTPELQAVIDRDRAQLQGEFCRSCGYCMPCPQGIVINQAARMSLLRRRAPVSSNLNDNGIAMMKKIETCLNCRSCADKCPYGLDTPALLQRNYKDFMEILVRV